MNKIYKVIFCKRTGKRIAVSECTKSSGKQSGGKAAVCVAAAAFAAGVALLGVGQVAQAQTLPEAPCTANAGGTMYNANPTCVNYVNNTRIYLDSLSTSTSTGRHYSRLRRRHYGTHALGCRLRTTYGHARSTRHHYYCAPFLTRRNQASRRRQPYHSGRMGSDNAEARKNVRP